MHTMMPSEYIAFRERIHARGETLVSQVHWLEGTRFCVPSSSDPTKSYTVDLATEKCNCPSWKQLNTSRYGLPAPMPPARCKHIVAVIIARNSKYKTGV